MKKKTTKKSNRGRKKNETTLLCQRSFVEYKKKDCIKIGKMVEPQHYIVVSKVWWEANKNDPKQKDWTFVQDLA